MKFKITMIVTDNEAKELNMDNDAAKKAIRNVLIDELSNYEIVIESIEVESIQSSPKQKDKL